MSDVARKVTSLFTEPGQGGFLHGPVLGERRPRAGSRWGCANTEELKKKRRKAGRKEGMDGGWEEGENHVFQHHRTLRVRTDRSVSVGLSGPLGFFIFHSEPWHPLWPKEQQVVWAELSPWGPPFLISRFCLSSHALFAFLPHHSKEMSFLLSHT